MNEIAGMDTWRPIPAVMDQVRITRDGNDAVIEYADPMISDTRLTIGSQIKGMMDKDIIDVFNGVMVAQRLMPAVSRFGRHIRCRICCPIPNPTTRSDCRRWRAIYSPTHALAGRRRCSGSTARWCRLERSAPCQRASRSGAAPVRRHVANCCRAHATDQHVLQASL